MNETDPVEVLYRRFSYPPYQINLSWVLPAKFTKDGLPPQADFKTAGIPQYYNIMSQK